MNRNVEKEIDKYPTYLQWRTLDFPDCGERGNHKRRRQPILWSFSPETAWKGKKLGGGGSFVPVPPVFISVNDCDDLDWTLKNRLQGRIISQGEGRSRSRFLVKSRTDRFHIPKKHCLRSVMNKEEPLWCNQIQTPRDSGQVMYNFLLLSQPVKSANILCGKFYLSHT